MKNIKLFMCLAFIAFTFPLRAQTTPAQNPQDTLQIRLQGRNQVFLTAASLRSLAEYQRADSLKTLFFADLEKSLAGGAFPETPKRIHYFVNQQGKRRLKAEVNDDAATKFDLAYEKTRMTLDLPPLHYTVYDLPRNVEIHFFLEDSAAFEQVNQTELTKAIKTLHKDRNKLTGLSNYRVEQAGFGFEKRLQRQKQYLTLEVAEHIGGMVLGNQVSPLLSIDFFMTLPIPSNTVFFRLGGYLDMFVLSEFQEGRFTNFNSGQNWQGYLQVNGNKKLDSWFGISMGQLSTDHPTGLPKHAFKFGIISTFGSNTFEFGSVNVNKDNSLFMMTYKHNIFGHR